MSLKDIFAIYHCVAMQAVTASFYDHLIQSSPVNPENMHLCTAFICLTVHFAKPPAQVK